MMAHVEEPIGSGIEQFVMPPPRLFACCGSSTSLRATRRVAPWRRFRQVLRFRRWSDNWLFSGRAVASQPDALIVASEWRCRRGDSKGWGQCPGDNSRNVTEIGWQHGGQPAGTAEGRHRPSWSAGEKRHAIQS
jgi:hypothetical protein